MSCVSTKRVEKKLSSSFDACHLHGLLSVSYLWLSRPIRSVVLRRGLTDSHFLVSSFIQFHPVPFFAMNPRFQDGSFQTAADMLRNQQREFVEPLMQQLAANLGDTLAGSTSCAVGQAVQAAQNRDVRPRREPDYGKESAQTFAEHEL